MRANMSDPSANKCNDTTRRMRTRRLINLPRMQSPFLLIAVVALQLAATSVAFVSNPTTATGTPSFIIMHQPQYILSNNNLDGLALSALSSSPAEDYSEFDDEDYDPLEDGVDSVAWLPSLSSDPYSSRSVISDATSTSPTTETLPFFPLGGIVYTPNSEHVLNIFEPRYRQMYTDILMNGSKRFVVSMSHPEKEGTFAQTGVIFYLEDLKEVSELTDDQVKYICNHKVTQRVQLKKVVNPEVWTTRETYLKVECEILYEDGENDKNAVLDNSDEDDDEEDEEENDEEENKQKNKSKTDVYKRLMDAVSTAAKPSSSSQPTRKRKSPQEILLMASFQNLVDKQHEAEEDVRFTKTSIDSLAVAPGSGEDGLWQTIRLWQSFIDQRLVARQNEMQREFQDKLIEFLKREKGMDEEQLPSAIGFNDLSPSLQKEVQDLQKRMNVELQPLVLESSLTIQKILEAKDHTARCLLLKHFMDVEKKRLDAKSTLQGMFAGNASAVTQVESNVSDNVAMDDEEEDDDDDDETSIPSSPTASSSSLLTDEPDAFQ